MAVVEKDRTQPTGRVPALDRLRGLAVVVMVLDHLLVVTEPAWAPWVRYSVTRAALPLFCILAGYLAVERGRVVLPRAVMVAGWGVFVGVAVAPSVGLPRLDVLVLIAGAVVAVAFLPERWRLWALVLAVLQPTTWPLVDYGYEPGLVVALALVGSLARSSWDGVAMISAGMRLPGWLAWVGRYPATVYVGHLLVLAVAVEL